MLYGLVCFVISWSSYTSIIFKSFFLLSFLHMKDIKFEEQVLLVNMFMLNCNGFVKFDSIIINNDFVSFCNITLDS